MSDPLNWSELGMATAAIIGAISGLVGAYATLVITRARARRLAPKDERRRKDELATHEDRIAALEEQVPRLWSAVHDAREDCGRHRGRDG